MVCPLPLECALKFLTCSLCNFQFNVNPTAPSNASRDGEETEASIVLADIEQHPSTTEPVLLFHSQPDPPPLEAAATSISGRGARWAELTQSGGEVVADPAATQQHTAPVVRRRLHSPPRRPPSPSSSSEEGVHDALNSDDDDDEKVTQEARADTPPAPPSPQRLQQQSRHLHLPIPPPPAPPVALSPPHMDVDALAHAAPVVGVGYDLPAAAVTSLDFPGQELLQSVESLRRVQLASPPPLAGSPADAFQSTSSVGNNHSGVDASGEIFAAPQAVRVRHTHSISSSSSSSSPASSLAVPNVVPVHFGMSSDAYVIHPAPPYRHAFLLEQTALLQDARPCPWLPLFPYLKDTDASLWHCSFFCSMLSSVFILQIFIISDLSPNNASTADAFRCSLEEWWWAEVAALRAHKLFIRLHDEVLHITNNVWRIESVDFVPESASQLGSLIPSPSIS